MTGDQLGSRRRWMALGVLCMSLTTIGIDGSILNIALPTLTRELGAGTSDLQWMVDSYVLVFAGLLLTAGSLGDRFGRRRALTVGLVVFGVSSAAAAFASDVTQVIAARAFMGIGAALIMPATLSILTNVFTDPRERGRAIGVWASVSALGSALGPVVGGVLLSHFWWGSIFLVNVPVVLLALLLGRIFVPESSAPVPGPLDGVGSLLSIVGLSALLWTIIDAPAHGWGSTTTMIGFASSFAVLGAFAVWERRNPHPMLDVTFFRNPRFTVASVAITMAFFSIFGSLFLITQMFQFVLRFDSLGAGLRLIPFALSFVAVAPFAPRLVERVGSKRMVAFGFGVASVGLFLLSRLTAHSSYLESIGSLMLMSTGMGLAMPSATESIMGSLPKEKAGVGSAMNDTTRQAGGALGVAVLGSLLVSGYRSSLRTGIDRLHLPQDALARSQDSVGAALQFAHRLGAGAGRSLAQVARESFMHGMHLSTLLGACMALGGAILALAYLPAHASGHHLNASEVLPVGIVIDDDELSPVPERG